MTPEEIQKSIDAAFDSVNLINQDVLLEKTKERLDEVERNYRHLEIMLAKEWFSEALTIEQYDDIDAAIEAGKSYVN
jgi:hypothetical protein